MNLIGFLKAVEEKCDLLSFEELRSFVYEYARTLPEQEREDFLEKLDFARKGIVFKEDLSEDLLTIKEKLAGIDEGERGLNVNTMKTIATGWTMMNIFILIRTV